MPRNSSYDLERETLAGGLFVVAKNPRRFFRTKCITSRSHREQASKETAEANRVANLPGNHRHRALLDWILNHYEDDERILAVVLIGSLARGDWDRYSDVDLDIIVADGMPLDLLAELAALEESARAADPVLLAVADGPDEGKLLFESFSRMSVRFHELDTTSPNILEDMLILRSSLSPTAIRAAGEGNHSHDHTTPTEYMDHFFVYASEAADFIARGQSWLALELLGRMRRLLIDLYASCAGKCRPLHAFGSLADQRLQRRLGSTLPAFSTPSLRDSLHELLRLAREELNTLSVGQLVFTPEWQRTEELVLLNLEEVDLSC